MRIFLILITLLISGIASAETEWKFGLGVGGISANSYPGASTTESVTSPIPYLKVKTDWFELDREGLHTNWFSDTRFRFDISFDLGLPAESDTASLRSGMADLNPVGLVGPMLVYQLFNSVETKWQLQLPLLLATEVDNLDLHSAGHLTNPRIYFSRAFEKSDYPLELNLSLGPVYASSDYFAYYYDVGAADALASRAQFESGGGFGGMRFNLSLTRRFEDYWAGLYLRYQSVDGAVFADSPLVEQNDYWFIAVGVSWLFAGSL